MDEAARNESNPPAAATPLRKRSSLPWQLLPPLLLLTLLAPDDGTTVLVMVVFAMPLALFSALRLVVKLFLSPRAWLTMLRPALTLAIIIAMQKYVYWSIDGMKAEGENIAARLQTACHKNKRCPSTLGIGKPLAHGQILLASPRGHLRWRADYLSTEKSFVFRLRFMTDMGREWRGGVEQPLSPPHLGLR